jgi:hypothetical protein
MHFAFPIGALLTILLVSAYKAILLGINISIEQCTAFAGAIFISDIPLLGAFGLFWYLSTLLNLRIIRITALFPLWFLWLFLVADAALVITLDSHIPIAEVYRYSRELEKLYTYADIPTVTGLLGLALLLFWRVKISRKNTNKLAALMVLAICAPVLVPQSELTEAFVKKYSVRTAFKWRRVLKPVVQGYSQSFAQRSNEHFETTTVLNLPDNSQNVILLVVESLSTIDTWIDRPETTPYTQLRRISSEGVFFKNFLANTSNTEGGLVSLLSAVTPLPFPFGTPILHRDYIRTNSVVRTFTKLGYHTEFLTNSDIQFLDQGTYCRGMGFDVVRGHKEVPEFQSLPKTTFLSPPDEHLYEEFFRRWDSIRDLPQPKFFTLFTISSHPPYVDPHIPGKASSEDEVYRYVDQQIGRFFDQLVERKFFDNGILLIVGDHRKLRPLTAAELRQHGDRAKARVPLIMVGKQISRGQVDQRLWSQSELFAKLEVAIGGESTLSREVIYFNTTDAQYNFGSVEVEFNVFTESKSFEARLVDSRLEWLVERPDNSEAIENEIHIQRASQQIEYKKWQSNSCQFLHPPSSVAQTALAAGLEVTMYRGTDIAHPLDQQSARFLSAARTNAIDFDPSFEGHPFNPEEKTSLVFRAYLEIKEPGTYLFKLSSDDGSCLGINGHNVIDANFTRPFYATEGSIYLGEGAHWVELRYFQDLGGAALTLEWVPPGEELWRPIPQKHWRYTP